MRYPGEVVYVVDDPGVGDNDCFRYGGYYWVFRDGYWYRAASWRGPFLVIHPRYVPALFYREPAPRWKHRPSGPPRFMNESGRGPRAPMHQNVSAPPAPGRNGAGGHPGIMRRNGSANPAPVHQSVSAPPAPARNGGGGHEGMMQKRGSAPPAPMKKGGGGPPGPPKKGGKDQGKQDDHGRK